MTQDEDDTGELPDLSNREILRVVMQEIADTNKELRGDIANLDTKLSDRIDAVASELHTLRLEVHQNQSTFIVNQAALTKRVKALEVPA
jgi:5-enolpyruvylshikimate-3-phosphate synthase